MSIFCPFSIPILSTEIDYDFSELRKDTRFIYNYGQDGTYTQDYRILETYPTLKQELLDASLEYIKTIGLTKDYTITTSWLTKVCKGELITAHYHKNCQFSGVLYYGEDYTNANPLWLINPTNKIDNFEQTPTGSTGLFSDYQVYPKTGLLIVFPFFLTHHMDKQKHDVARHSLAFNLHPTGVIGNGDSQVDVKWLL